MTHRMAMSAVGVISAFTTLCSATEIQAQAKPPVRPVEKAPAAAPMPVTQPAPGVYTFMLTNFRLRIRARSTTIPTSLPFRLRSAESPRSMCPRNSWVT